MRWRIAIPLIVLLAPVLDSLIPSTVHRASVFDVPPNTCQFHGTIQAVYSTQSGYWAVKCSERGGYIFLPK